MVNRNSAVFILQMRNIVPQNLEQTFYSMVDSGLPVLLLTATLKTALKTSSSGLSQAFLQASYSDVSLQLTLEKF